MTLEEKQEKAKRILAAVGTLAVTATGPAGASVGIALSVVGPLVETAVMLWRGEEPTDLQLAKADEACEVSNIEMNDDANERLRQLGHDPRMT